MYVLALSPKIVAVTNRWVWNSPFYSQIIRNADFLPLYEGVDSSLDLIQDRVNNGYSILIFPEGHRSREGEIRRFHQGAFYIAKHLHLPIVPIILRGVGYVLPKGSLFLNRSSVTAEIGSRFSKNSTLCTLSTKEEAKNFRIWYKKSYRELHLRVATPRDYFWLMRLQYAFRGQEIVTEFIKRWHNSYHFEVVINQLPSKGKVIFTNSGFGFDSLIVALMRPDLQVYGWEPNIELRQVASSIGLNPSNLHYPEQEPNCDSFFVVPLAQLFG